MDTYRLCIKYRFRPWLLSVLDEAILNNEESPGLELKIAACFNIVQARPTTKPGYYFLQASFFILFFFASQKKNKKNLKMVKIER